MRKILTQIMNSKQDGISIKAVLSLFFSLSKHEISQLKYIEDGILCNGKKVYTNHIVKEKDVVEVRFLEEKNSENNKKHGLRILYEDEDVIVVDKPAGIVCHATHGYLDEHLGKMLQEEYGLTKVRVIGRLDNEVTGVILYAKSQQAASRLTKQRQLGLLKKKYYAIVEGSMPKKKDVLKYSLYREEGIRKGVDWKGKDCITKYEVVFNNEKNSLLKIEIQTGKSHQIRAGLSALNYPIVGDSLYEGSVESIQRVALHCYQLTFLQPFTNEKIEVIAELPKDMAALMADIK
ncbi:MAG: RluA family pseudouridine synthase [Solobacterium sp.]|nr:RluA family pseudouridine synthase [Solobacterium sp.]